MHRVGRDVGRSAFRGWIPHEKARATPRRLTQLSYIGIKRASEKSDASPTGARDQLKWASASLILPKSIRLTIKPTQATMQMDLSKSGLMASVCLSPTARTQLLLHLTDLGHSTFLIFEELRFKRQLSQERFLLKYFYQGQTSSKANTEKMEVLGRDQILPGSCRVSRFPSLSPA